MDDRFLFEPATARTDNFLHFLDIFHYEYGLYLNRVVALHNQRTQMLKAFHELVFKLFALFAVLPSNIVIRDSEHIIDSSC